MSRDDREPKAEQPITLTMSQLQELLKAERTAATEALAATFEPRMAEYVANVFTSKSPDERIKAAMDQQRGVGRPQAPETIVPCRSPITGATFTVRSVSSKTYPQGRIIEIYDYVRPAGWDKHKEDGGLFEGPRDQMQIKPETGYPSLKYTYWVAHTFWMVDWNALSGKPLSFIDQWRIPAQQQAAAE